MEFIPTLSSYASDSTAQTVWAWFNAKIAGQPGVAFYKYPNVGDPDLPQPDLTILTRSYDPLVIRCANWRTEDILAVDADSWTVKIAGGSQQIDSPLLVVEDIAVAMQEKFDKERPLRKAFKVHQVLALPLVDRARFEESFGDQYHILWDAVDVSGFLSTIAPILEDDQWRLAQSVIQAAVPLTRRRHLKVPEDPQTFGQALDILENDIALLDMQQQLAGVQIPPGPQRIRGLAGTGKTVLLALKAANIHRQFKDAKILFTFNTQSLYNQAQYLIGRFYRHFSGVEPDFDRRLHVRHAWGGKRRAGVYSDACERAGIAPMDLATARSRNRENPFAECCRELLQSAPAPTYDYSLIDEGQDFPKEFFQLVYAITKGQMGAKPIYFAYDELQSLEAVIVPTAAELFGKDSTGTPLVNLDGEYPGPIEKDFVLHKSYRCPREILMIAHALGLGLYRPKGPIQMLSSLSSWTSVGYEVTGKLQTGERVTIYRPDENSPNRIGTLYKKKKLFTCSRFSDRNSELDYVADGIKATILDEGVKPEQIVVISLDSRSARAQMSLLQAKLLDREIRSIIPGFSDDQADFAKEGMVTLATVHRAKGNEAPVVYILNFDYLFDYVEEISNRNKAFTAISRSKAWVRISGIGPQMEAVKQEVEKIRADLPRLSFIFPDMERIRRLDSSETSRRKKEVKKASEMAARLTEIDVDALRKIDPSLLETLLRKLSDAKDED
jgi:superfamily I DNA and RNA helicase